MCSGRDRRQAHLSQSQFRKQKTRDHEKRMASPLDSPRAILHSWLDLHVVLIAWLADVEGREGLSHGEPERHVCHLLARADAPPEPERVIPRVDRRCVAQVPRWVERVRVRVCSGVVADFPIKIHLISGRAVLRLMNGTHQMLAMRIAPLGMKSRGTHRPLLRRAGGPSARPGSTATPPSAPPRRTASAPYLSAPATALLLGFCFLKEGRDVGDRVRGAVEAASAIWCLTNV